MKALVVGVGAEKGFGASINARFAATVNALEFGCPWCDFRSRAKDCTHKGAVREEPTQVLRLARSASPVIRSWHEHDLSFRC